MVEVPQVKYKNSLHIHLGIHLLGDPRTVVLLYVYRKDCESSIVITFHYIACTMLNLGHCAVRTQPITGTDPKCGQCVYFWLTFQKVHAMSLHKLEVCRGSAFRPMRIL